MKLNEKARKRLDGMVEQFQAGDISSIVEMARICLDKDAPARRWSWSNRIIAYAQTGSADCRGFKQWQGAGRQVKKGQVSAYILGPKIKKETDEKNGEETSRLIGWFAIPVFGYNQTDPTNGADATINYEPRELPPLHEVAERLGMSIEYTPTVDNTLGICGSTRIVLGSHDPSVFFHELGHAAHDRIANGSGRKQKKGQDPHKETVAELTAAVLMNLYGFDWTGNAWSYIEHYNDDPLRAIMKALSEVGQVLDLIFDDENPAQSHDKKGLTKDQKGV